MFFLDIIRKKWNGPPGSGAACLQVVSGQVKNQISYLKSYGLTYLHIIRQNYNWTPGSGADGLQVDLGDVKNLNFLLVDLGINF